MEVCCIISTTNTRPSFKLLFLFFRGNGYRWYLGDFDWNSKKQQNRIDEESGWFVSQKIRFVVSFLFLICNQIFSSSFTIVLQCLRYVFSPLNYLGRVLYYYHFLHPSFSSSFLSIFCSPFLSIAVYISEMR